MRGCFSAIDSVLCLASLLRCNNICRYSVDIMARQRLSRALLASSLCSLFCSFCSLLLLSLSSLSIVVHVPNEYRLSNTRECTCQIKSVIFTVSSIVAWLTLTSLIWSDRNLHRFILCGMVDPTSLIWNVSTRSRIFSHHKALVWEYP